MKKFAFLALLIPSVLFAQEDRKEVSSHEVTSGFYGNLSVNQVSQFDETINGKIAAGMHFNNFHIGAHYLTSFGETDTKVDRIDAASDTKIKYSGFGLDLMYEVEVHEKFSIAPMLNLSLMNYEYDFSLITALPVAAITNKDDKFLNTQIGAKLFFTPNKNFKLGFDLGYNIANGVNLYNTEDADLSGMNFGITLQFNHFNPKW